MSRQDALHAEHFVMRCRIERERFPLSERVVSMDFVRGESDGLHSEVDKLAAEVTDFDMAMLRQAG